MSVFLSAIFWLSEDNIYWASFAQSALRYELMYFFSVFSLSLTLGARSKAEKSLWVACIFSFIPLFITTFALSYGDMPLPCADPCAQVEYLNATDRLYFSVVTFTTLGYGDIQPAETHRLLAAFEAFIGFLFVPIVIAELTTVIYKS